MEQNQFFLRATSPSEYLFNYVGALNSALLGIDSRAMTAAYSRIKETAKNGGTIFVAGNGGSAAISEHLMCDFMKGSGLKVVSLVSNVSLLTAMANDLEYAEIFAQKLRMLGACSRDCLMLISSSGNSSNVLRAADFAKEASIPVIGLTGFSGGNLRMLSDVSLHVNAHNYGIIEDAHQAIMHILAQWHSISGQ
jgi:D-sedoheptulose 7-phosphate isomerase